MIEFLSYVYLVGAILIMLFLHLTNAFVGGCNKEFVLCFIGMIFWPIVAGYLILKLFTKAIVFSVQEIAYLVKF